MAKFVKFDSFWSSFLFSTQTFTGSNTFTSSNTFSGANTFLGNALNINDLSSNNGTGTKINFNNNAGNSIYGYLRGVTSGVISIGISSNTDTFSIYNGSATITNKSNNGTGLSIYDNSGAGKYLGINIGDTGSNCSVTKWNNNVLGLSSPGGYAIGNNLTIDTIGNITTNGKIYVGDSSVSYPWICSGNFVSDGSSLNGINVKNKSTVYTYFVNFWNSSNTQIGSIYQNTATSILYNTTSDKRLKENIKDTHYSLKDLLKIKVRDYNWKKDKDKKVCIGFIAQELYEIYPDAVSVGTNEVDKKGQLKRPWGVDYGKLTPILVKSVQDLNKKIESQKMEIQSQKTEIEDLKKQIEDIKKVMLQK